MTPHILLNKIKTIPIKISFMNFPKFHEFVFFSNRNFVRKVAFFPIYLIQKGYIGHKFKDRPRFTTITTRYGFFHTRNTMYITYAKLKKKSRSRFFKPQPAQASLSIKQADTWLFEDIQPQRLTKYSCQSYAIIVFTYVRLINPMVTQIQCCILKSAGVLSV